MGFCKRCGDIINTEKCAKCGGAAVSGVVKFSGEPGSPKKADRWEKKYTHRRSASPPLHSSRLQQLDPNTVHDRYPATPSPKKRFPRPTSVDLSNPFPRPTSNFRKEPLAISQVLTLGEDVIVEETETGPVVPMDDGITLAKVHGTVLLPPAPLKCAHCNTLFPPNSTLYPLSASESADPCKTDLDITETTGPYACLACFTEHRSLGTCGTCYKSVLPLKAQGAWITVRDSVWHGRCFSCRGCGVDLSKRPTVGISEDPECEECFGKVLQTRASPSNKDKVRERTKEAMSEMQGFFGTPATPKKASEPAELPSTPTARPTSTISPSATCSICTNPLLPPPGQTAPLVTAEGQQYHASCFVCCYCKKAFVDVGREATAVFAFIGEKPAHPSCAPTMTTNVVSSMHKTTSLKKTILPVPNTPPKLTYTLPAPISPSKRDAILALPRPLSRSPSKARPSSIFPPPVLASSVLPRPTSPQKSPTFGISLHCPSCQKNVSPMERGTVPGPGGGRWHATCLKCGAENKGEPGEGEEQYSVDPEALKGRGCGKKLDTGAKEAGGRVWCRRCWDDLPPTIRPVSPTRVMPLSPTHTGTPHLGRTSSLRPTTSIFPRRRESLALTPQMTGLGLPINRQLTGSTFSPSQGLARQATGTGYQTSPTKGNNIQFANQMTTSGIINPTRRPRSLYAPAFSGMLENVSED
ncbi:hypothetical protein DACRYDRAFT_116268 [Dacryopinax primogenitus]|uniref:LIM zinc-binding domain-containing protein n=1 Tax=Dacryopinax primogenitus (strain DJM 731) TaxID=1858805 RepID=M5GCL0_DACPD|nr:uncharacterized protein DACRYDRAFT_116268 [Dacryopinax primogenitus]EJU01833.1 hypothetical protein DACRYDRAFT_116268 [Dacryopinax primogenitus]